jgi:hypothetical protein
VIDVRNSEIFEKWKNREIAGVEVNVSDTVQANAPRVLYFVLGEQRDASDVLRFLRRFLQWHGTQNVYPVSAGFLEYSVQWKKGPTLIKDLNDWHQFWGLTEPQSIQGIARFQGGDVVAKAATTPEKLTTGDFRLRPDSAGYHAGPEGNDLGAEIELVGPGKAYERWKKTPAYRQWLSEMAATDK